ncbi:MAG TPA: PH domain-containing protein [Syntrophorhabdaceae bacterium]|jgi:uncharacterized membrane protein YdbT with pleckstrin-like domain|nr:PH domain-containing protein [Syntrophorhabdaceae bacterium]
MGYIEKNLMFDEKVLFTTQLHPVVYAGSIAVGLAAILAAIMLPASKAISNWYIAAVMLVVAAAWFACCKIIVITSEFAVTSKRVLIKTGFVARDAWEMHLTRIEGVQIEQGLLGRMLNFGTVTVKGIGGSSDPFKNISRPLELRRAVVEAMSSTQGSQSESQKTEPQTQGTTQEAQGAGDADVGDDAAVSALLEENRKLTAALKDMLQARRNAKVAVAEAGGVLATGASARTLDGANQQHQPTHAQDGQNGKVEKEISFPREISFPKWDIPGRNNQGELVD